MSLAGLFKTFYAAGFIVAGGVRAYHRRRNRFNRISEYRSSIQDRSSSSLPSWE